MQFDMNDISDLDGADMPQRRSLGWFMKSLLAVLVAVGGWVVTTGLTHVWNLKADTSVVAQMANDIHAIRESQSDIKRGVDSVNTRLTQIRCGPKVIYGCR